MAYVCTLLDDYENKTYPITVIDAIYDNNGIKLETILDTFALASDLKNYATKDHTHPEYQTTAGMSNYATTAHSHAEYLTTAKAASDYAPKDHTHNQYQTTVGMSNYATTSHTHSQYLSTSGTAANSNKLGNVAASAYLTTASGKKFYEVSGTLAAGATSLSLSNGNITTASTIDVYSSVYGISPTKMTVSAGKVNMTFDAQTVAATIKVRAS